MRVAILPLYSDLHDQNRANDLIERFNNAISFDSCLISANESFHDAELLIAFVLTGGCEQNFVEKFNSNELLSKKLIIASLPEANSLPAALEIFTWLKQRECEHAKHIHGNIDALTHEIREILKYEAASETLRGQRFGIIGRPSDWLIASTPSLIDVEDSLGCKAIEIEMEEFAELCEKPEDNALAAFAQHFYSMGMKDKTAPLARAAKIYAGLKLCIKKHDLSGLTLRCFDILNSSKTTGCLAIAKLNDDGIPASCEGDLPTLLTMAMIKVATGQTSFMANPSSINGDEIIFAHCTCPTSMLQNIQLNTHFESGQGLAIQGEFKGTDYTIFKLSPQTRQYALQQGQRISMAFQHNLCRTQIRLSLKGAGDYFMQRPLANHHVLIHGQHQQVLEKICMSLGFEPVW